MLARPDLRLPASTASALPLAVVVGGADNGGGLGLVRSLGAAAIPIAVLDREASASALHSRFARTRIITELSGRPLVDTLLSLGKGAALRPVLFLTTDEAVLTVSQHRDELAPLYRLRLPEHDRLTAIASKADFQKIAEAQGFPVPRAVQVKSLADIGKLASLTFPVVIKPANKTQAYLASAFARGYRIGSIEEAERLCRDILPTLPDLIVQEWIEGTDRDLYFCLQYRGSDGMVASFTGRKLSIWPPDIGTTASCVAAPEAHAALAPLTDAFFKAVSFAGMGSMEYKRDARTGGYVMIEPTVGRVDWQEEVATLNGVNIPLAAYCHEAGVPLFAPSANPPVIWCDTARHWRAVRYGCASPPPRGAQTADPYWRLNDPVPALFHVVSTLIRLWRRAMKRAGGWSSAKAR
jgi:D-aspartate ligase